MSERNYLENSPYLLAAIVESSDDVIVSKTLDGIIMSWNTAAEKLFGYTKEEAIGKHISLIIPKERLEEENIIIGKVSRNEKVDHFETVRISKTGRLIPLSITVSPVRNAEGKVVGASKVARDISDRKRTEEILAHEAKRKDQFIAMLAHELRNPLAPILNALEIMHRSQARSDEDVWVVGIMDRQVKHMARLIDDLLDIGRITSDKLVLKREPVTVQSIFDMALESSQPLIDERNHELTVSLPNETLMVNVDQVRMSQIVANLVNNAAKYTEPGGKVWVTAEKDGADVRITVRDTGRGLAPNKTDEIFELFSQSEDSKSGGIGLGIGLSLVKKLTEMHGGTVVAESPGVGLGSTFVVRIPGVTTGQDQREGRSEETRLPSNLKVLVVDDNVDAADSLNLLLQNKEWEIRVAYDGLEAFQVAQAFRPEVILLDIGMPKLNGLDVAKLIRKESWGRDILLIATTGWGQEADKLSSIEAGFDHHLVKPVRFNELQRIISNSTQAGT